MRPLLSVLAVFLSMSVPLGFKQDIPSILSSSSVHAQADSTWPMFHHDMHHTGLSPLTGDMSTCYLLWVYGTGDGITAGPVLGDIDSDGNLEVVVGSYDGRLRALNGEDGSFLWSHYNTGAVISGSAALGDVDGDDTLEVIYGSHYGRVYALNGEDGSWLWEYRTGWYVRCSPALGDIDGDDALEVVVGSQDDTVYALNAEDGSFLWSYATGDYIYVSSPALGDIDGDDTLEVVIGSWDNNVYALDGEDGGLLWSYTTGGRVYSSAALGDIDGDDTLEVVIGSWDNNVYALNGHDGSLLWSYTTGAYVSSSPALGDIDGDGNLEVVVGSDDSCVYALNGEDGSFLWSYMTGNAVGSSPALGDIDGDGSAEVVVGSNDYNIYALNGEDGSFLWSYTTGYYVGSSPALGDIDGDGSAEVVVGCHDNMIYALNGDTTPPLSFNLISPVDSGILVITRPTFTWEPSFDSLSGLQNYDVYINDTLRYALENTYWTADYDLREGYHDWYIVAYDSVGNSRQSDEVWAVGIDTTGPPMVSLISPADAGYEGDSIINFFWQRPVDNLSGVDHYDLRYALDTIFSQGLVETTIVDTAFTALLSDTSYYWQVRAIDSVDNTGDWSSVWSFTVDTESPTVPVLLGPVGGVYLTESIVTFEWSQVTFGGTSSGEGEASKCGGIAILAAPIRYVLELDTFDVFASPVLADTVDTTSAVLSLADDFYWWRVKAFDLAGNESPFSGIDSFVVDITPPLMESTTIWTDTSHAGPFPVYTKVTDLSGVDSVILYFRRMEDPAWFLVEMVEGSGDWYYGEIPSVALENDTVKYYIYARDILEQASTEPSGAPTNYYWFVANTTRIEEFPQDAQHFSFRLQGNPSRGKIAFELSLPEDAEVTLTIYDVSGRLTDEPISGTQSAGTHEISWTAEAGAGIYFYRLQSPWRNEVGKLVLIK